MSERDWPPFDDPNWRSLRDIIAFVSRHFSSVRMAETKLYAVLVSRDLLSIRERADGEREPLTCWEKIKFSVVASIYNPWELDSDDDIDIVLGDDDDEWLSPYSIFGWWPDVERLCGLTVAQPGRPVPKSETAASAPPTAESGASTSASTPSAPAPAASDQGEKPKDWLRISKRNHPRAKDETHHAWAERQLQLMRDEHALGKVRSVWTLENMIRRLRDKDAED
jgi:hypothetical protein